MDVKLISYKTQWLLGILIPFFGFFAAIATSFVNLKRLAGRLTAMYYLILSLLPFAVFVLGGAFGCLFIARIENYALAIGLIVMVAFVALEFVSVAAILIERVIIKKFNEE